MLVDYPLVPREKRGRRNGKTMWSSLRGPSNTLQTWSHTSSEEGPISLAFWDWPGFGEEEGLSNEVELHSDR